MTPVGEQAFVDITTCLTSGKSKALDVFYLIDKSGSLKYTDPQNVRSEILKNSLTGLAKFSDQGIKVSYSVAAFGSDVQPISGWRGLDATTDFEAVVAEATDMSPHLGNTDWERAIREAQRSLDERQNSCKMLIWFTDGGINPDAGASAVFPSLSDLCRPGITSRSLGAADTYGLMEELRLSQVSIFGVLYQNDASTLDWYVNNDGKTSAEAQQRLNLEHYRMSFMRPLVEGSGEVGTGDSTQTKTLLPMPAPGPIKCGNVDADGFMPAGVPNGAFLNAQDPVSLAFQFLKLENQIAGGADGAIDADGNFVIKPGTAEFTIITDAEVWSLEGPEGSVFAANSQNPGPTVVTQSAGATTLTVDLLHMPDSPELVGEWKFEADKANVAQLYVYSGLTLELDRDITSQVISNFDNTLTGSAVRTEKFADVKERLDLSVFESADLSLEVLKDGKRVPVDGVKYDMRDDGVFTITGFNPGENSDALDLWVTVDIGNGFQPIVSKFTVDTIDSKAFAIPEYDLFTLTPLEGPSGKATGSLVIVGPTTGSAEFCIAAPALRTSDHQTGVDNVERTDSFGWQFESTAAKSDSGCFVVPSGQTVEIAVTATNPKQANGHVVSVFGVSSTTPTASFEIPLQIEFDSKTQGNSAVATAVIVGLLLLGLLIPLGLLAMFNRIATKFLPMENVYRAEYPVVITPGLVPKMLRSSPDGSSKRIEVGPQDFVAQADRAAEIEIPDSAGTAKARVPIFPLAATWYEMQATEGSRLISMQSSGEKSPRYFSDGSQAELSPNMAENWVMSLSDVDLAGAPDQDLPARLIVFAAMSNLPQYQARINEISQTPGIADRIAELRESVSRGAARNTRSPRSTKLTSELLPDAAPQSSGVTVTGFSQAGSGPLAAPGEVAPTVTAQPQVALNTQSPPMSGKLAPPAPPA